MHENVYEDEFEEKVATFIRRQLVLPLADAIDTVVVVIHPLYFQFPLVITAFTLAAFF